MTPKEKAKQLYDKYLLLIDSHEDIYWDIEQEAKKCALIAVDELILNSHNQKTDDYWQQVKTEIENL